MQINKPKKSIRNAKKKTPNTLFDNDFASGFEESKFDKFKPALKVFIAIIILMTAVWGVSAYLGSTEEKDNANKDYSTNTTQQTDDSHSKLSQCIADAAAKNPTPETSDANFYPKLISGYDAQLACYDQYPNATAANSRSSVESARDSALDSSGSYKDSYASSGGGSSSSKNSITGCDYSLSESEYLACSDRYYAAHNSPSGSSPSDTGNTSTPSYTPSTPTPSNPPSDTGSTGQQADPYAELNACLTDARSLPTEASRARAVQGCYQNYTPNL